MTQINYTETLIVTSCWCGVAFAIPEERHEWMQRSSKNSCYCPNGHSFHYTNSLETQLQRERQRHQATTELLRAEERSHQATRGHLTRAKKRAAAGVCPCCHRTFKQLARHMQAKHPDFIEASA
jgi:protein-arginine kinase activator protein McsA